MMYGFDIIQNGEKQHIKGIWETGYFQELFKLGNNQALRQIGSNLSRATNLVRSGRFGGAHVLLTKDIASTAFDVFQPEVTEFIRRWVYDFCAATNETATLELAQALSDLQAAFATGLAQGEAQKKLTDKVQELFDDPFRAHRIAATESSRAMHGGGRMAAEEAGVTTHEWLASSDACPKCLALARMGPIPLSQPYATDASSNPRYAVIWHPGLHPFCFCTETFA